MSTQFEDFVSEFKRRRNEGQENLWLMKPATHRQGKGVFFISKLSEITPEVEAMVKVQYE